MPKLQHTFVQGKMNKDLDERLVPNGQYRDAQNIQITTSEGSDVGAVENILGNTKKNLKSTDPDVYWPAGFGLDNPVCVGSIRWNHTNKIYWFIASDRASVIAEYDEPTSIVKPVLVDVNNILNFDPNRFITGINILDNFLIWTDNVTEPKKINIESCKGGSVDFSTQTRLYGRDFIESDITVIKKRPQTAPLFEAKATKKTGTGVGCGIDPVTVSYNFTMAGTGSFTVPYQTGAVLTIDFGQEADWAVDDFIIFSGSQENEKNLIDEYRVRAKITAIPTAAPWEYEIEIASISSDMPGLLLSWDVILEESEPMFNLKFPRLAYRWKYVDGEYSGYSPFTSVVFIPDSFEYRTSKAFNEGMANNLRYLRIYSFETPPADVSKIEILYKEAGSTGIYKIDEISASTSDYEIDTEILGGAIEPNQLLRAWDNVPRKALGQELVGNRIVYGNYTQGYDIEKPSLTATKVTIAHNYPGEPLASVKSMRSYQLGVVFGDEYGRETPVFTSDNAGVIFDKKQSNRVNSIIGNVTTPAPSWASYFKFYIKDTSNEYYNLALDRFYEADDGNLWLAFPSAERNKVSEGQFINLKKAHDTNTAVADKARYKILDISNDVPDDVSTEKLGMGAFDLTTITNFTAGKSSIDFQGPQYADNPEFFKAFQSNNFIRVKCADDWSSYYEIKDAGVTAVNSVSGLATYRVTIVGSFKDEVDNIGAIERIYVYEPKKTVQKEHLGKFFVKINRDSEFEDYIINPMFALNPVYNKIYNSNIIPGGEIYDDPTDDLTDLATFGWQENGAPYPANPPAAGSNDMTLFYAPHTDAGSLLSGAAWFDNIEAGSFIKFNSGEVYYEVDSVTTTREAVYNAGSPPDNIDDWGLKKTIVFKAPLVAADVAGGPEYDFGVYAPSTNWEVLFDQFDKTLSSSLPAIFETEPKETAELDIYYEVTDAIPVASIGTPLAIDYFNCYSFGNGVESNRIRDDFNAPIIDKGTKVSATLEEPYGEESKGSSLIYSGIYNSTSGFNQLNQFNMAESITKDLEPIAGSIQKLHARDTNLIALCEDKVYTIFADKDALYNADGNINLTATNRVLGNASAFAGEFGISKNPESFASYGFRAYFTDKSRNAVLRLSMDGLTEISDKGMRSFFQDAFKASPYAIGSFDERTDSYNVSLNGETIAFKEQVNGWVTRKTFVPETGVSINGEYYTFQDGELWVHNNPSRANFYGSQYDATITPIINDAPTSIKNFKTLSYEGNEGWVADVITDQQDGEVKTWKKKEGIFFNYINGLATTWDNTAQSGALDTSEFSVQGLGVLTAPVSEPTLNVFEITLPGNVNVSLQANDPVYYKDATDDKVYIIGKVSAINNGNMIVVINTYGAAKPEVGDFLFFAKDSVKNTSGIVGYYAEVLMTLSGSDPKELFAVNSEVFISSE